MYKELIDDMESQIRLHEDLKLPFDEISFQNQYGVIITVDDAKFILQCLKLLVIYEDKKEEIK